MDFTLLTIRKDPARVEKMRTVVPPTSKKLMIILMLKFIAQNVIVLNRCSNFIGIGCSTDFTEKTEKIY